MAGCGSLRVRPPARALVERCQSDQITGAEQVGNDHVAGEMVPKINPAGSDQRNHSSEYPNNCFAEKFDFDMLMGEVSKKSIDTGVDDYVSAWEAGPAQSRFRDHDFRVIRARSFHRALDGAGD